MPLSAIGGEIKSQVLNDNFSYLDSTKLGLDKLHYVNVKDYGAKGDGITDDTQAFTAAMGSGSVQVIVPSGTYRVSGIRIPSNTRLIGMGPGSTIIKLTDSAPNTTNLITNSDPATGNSRIWVEGIYVDWNKNRPGGTTPITTGMPDGCGVIFINSQYVVVKNVKSVDAGRHCFDVSANKYHKSGDNPEYYEPDGCKFVSFIDCEATGAGDDNFTTHFSEYIWIKNCYSYNPSGYMFTGSVTNTNCFEIDDGSRHVWVDGCYAYGGARGFEAKAHDHSPAPYDVKFTNCIAEGSIRTFDLRHVGFLDSTDPDSKTAFDVTIENCTAINPKTKSYYPSLSPRALAIAAYRNVNVSNFTAIGGSDEVTEEVISLYQKSAHVNLNNISVRGFKNADLDIRLVGGSNKTGMVNLSNISLRYSALRGISVGTDIDGVNIMGVVAQNDSRTGTEALAISSTATNVNTFGIVKKGYLA